MQQIIQTLEMRKEQLRRSALCAMIADNSLPPESRLCGAPGGGFWARRARGPHGRARRCLGCRRPHPEN